METIYANCTEVTSNGIEFVISFKLNQTDNKQKDLVTIIMPLVIAESTLKNAAIIIEQAKNDFDIDKV